MLSDPPSAPKNKRAGNVRVGMLAPSGEVVGVVLVVVDDPSSAGAGVEFGPLVATAPLDCASLSAHASGVGSASTRHSARPTNIGACH